MLEQLVKPVFNLAYWQILPVESACARGTRLPGPRLPARGPLAWLVETAVSALVRRDRIGKGREAAHRRAGDCLPRC